MIKEILNETRKRIAGLFKAGPPDASRLTAGFFSPFAAVTGEMQPTDFDTQVRANESWVYACAMAIAESVAMAKIQLKIKKGDKVDTINSHIFLDVWNAVNPFMNNFELRELTEIYQLLTGNAYWYILKNKLGVPQEIWPVLAQYMKIVPDEKEFIKGYIYAQYNSEPIAFDADEIVHFKYPNPNNIFYGVGPLFAAAYEVDMNTAMNKYQSAIFKNKGVPDGLLSTDQVVSAAETVRMRDQWKSLYGGTTNAGKVAILSKGLKYQQIQMTAEELSYVQSKNVNRDSILGIFRVPKSILGITEDVNRANAEATEYIFNLRNIQPKLIRSQEKINEKIMPLYKQTTGAILVFEYINIVPENRELLIKERDSRLDKGVTTINEERTIAGFKPVEWGDIPLLPINIAPLGSQPPQMPGPQQQSQMAAHAHARKELTEEQKQIRIRNWMVYKARFTDEVYNFKNHLARLFKRQEREVIEALNKYHGKGLTKDTTDAIIFEVEYWNKEFAEVCGPDYDDAYTAGYKTGQRAARISAEFDIDNPQSQAFLRSKKLVFSFRTNEVTREELKAELSEGLRAGETTKELTARVQKVFDFAKIYRSERIARTEIADAENHALLDSWSGSDAVEGKEWLHGGGGDTPRPEHIAMDGEQVGNGERFSNGLAYPGDPSQGPGEICNCTCTMLPILTK